VHRAPTNEAGAAGASLFPGQPGVEPNVAGAVVSGDDPSHGAADGGRDRRTNNRRCTALRADGRPCRATPQRSRATCTFHDPDRADQGVEARRLGGLHRRRVRTAADEFDFAGLADAESIRKLLEIAAVDALNLDSSIGRVRLLIATAIAAMRHLEVSDLAARLSVLEAAYRAAGRIPDSTPITIDVTESGLPELDE